MEIDAGEKKSVSLDEVLIKFGIFGHYHVKLMFLLSLTFATNIMFSYNYIFAVEKTEYRCKNSISLYDIQRSNSNKVEQFNPRCYERVALAEGTSCVDVNNTEVVPCKEWVYERPDSFVAEIACQEWKRALVGTAHCIGSMTSLLLCGPISDRFGRKNVYIITSVLGGVIGVTKSFVTNYWLYIVFEFVEPIIGDSGSPGFMLVIEMLSTSDRPLFLMLTSMGDTTGHILIAIIAWKIHYWRNVLLFIYAPAIFFILYILCIDESPRWLLTKGKKQEAIDILKKAAKTNGITLDKTVLENLKCEDMGNDNDMGYVTMLKNTFNSKIILNRFLVCLVWWITANFLSYGVAVNAVFLNGNKYVNFILLYLVEFPGSIVYGLLLKYCKRKIPLMLCFFGAALFFSVHPFIPAGYFWLSLVCYIGGNIMVTLFFNITYVFTSELFPTCTRNTMHALCSSIGRVGSILAQQMPLLLLYWHGLPSVLFAGMALLAGLLTLLVPDTADDDLPDTIRQAEEIGTHGEEKLKTRL